MSWNPFRSSHPKKSVVSKTAEREFEKEVKKLEELDESSKKLYKDMKKCLETNSALTKSERKIVQNLLNSGLNQNEDGFHRHLLEWDMSLDRLDKQQQELNSKVQKTVVEPMKKFNSIFPTVQNAIKKREQSLLEYNRCQARLDKYQERDRTGQVAVKLDASKKALFAAKEDFNTQNTALRQDLPKLNEGRIDYFKPCLEALVKSEIAYNTEQFKTYTELSCEMTRAEDSPAVDPKARINQYLTEIKGLSITVDD